MDFYVIQRNVSFRIHMYFYALFTDAVNSLDYKIPRELNDKIDNNWLKMTWKELI